MVLTLADAGEGVMPRGGDVHGAGKVVVALRGARGTIASGSVLMPICSGESTATVVAMASRNPCGLTEMPKAVRVYRVIRRWAWVELMPRFCFVNHKAGQGVQPNRTSWRDTPLGPAPAGRGRAGRWLAGLGLRRRDLAIPAVASALEMPAELRP